MNCPNCHAGLQAQDWTMPGMRILGILKCPQCSREYYGDLAVGQGRLTPILLEKATGRVMNGVNENFYSKWLKLGYQQRSDQAVGFKIHPLRPPRTDSPLILLNCLDVLYGHCLLKLLNAQYYLDHCPDKDLIILVPSFLRWMVPEGVTAIWEVDWPLSMGYRWNDWLAARIRSLVTAYREVFVSVAYSHPHPEDYDISRFVRVNPFIVTQWDQNLDHPKITFIWREDRLWAPQKKRFARLWYFLLLFIQVRRVSALANALKSEIPGLEFAVAGLGRFGKFPHWIQDLRVEGVTEEGERAWCKLYADSHVVVGVHGSNMLIPSSLAGSVIDLMPEARWGNILQDILFRAGDLREALYRCRFLPLQTNPSLLAGIVKAMLFSHRNMEVTMARVETRHKDR